MRLDKEKVLVVNFAGVDQQVILYKIVKPFFGTNSWSGYVDHIMGLENGLSTDGELPSQAQCTINIVIKQSLSLQISLRTTEITKKLIN